MLALQSLLIVGLVCERRARRRAELEPENLALAADASRRETMSALTGSIAHELGQPLSSMIHNAQALQMMARQSGDVRHDRRDRVRYPGSGPSRHADHRSSSDDAPQSPAGEETHRSSRCHQRDSALVAHDMQARHVKATLHLSSTPCVISGDQVLLQQVFVNLVMNAMDAMAGTRRPTSPHDQQRRQGRGCQSLRA